MGALFVVLADTVGRVVLPPAEVQVGIMTAVVGVPAFLRAGAARPDGRPVMAALSVLEPGATRDPDAVRRARRTPRRRSRLVVAGLSLALLLAFAARVLLGDFTYTIPDFFRILFGADLPGATYILMESKLPRAVLAVLVGLAFGVGGAIFQTTLRNPLASPDIIGVSAGASASAVVAIVVLDLRRLAGVGGRGRSARSSWPPSHAPSPATTPASAWCWWAWAWPPRCSR